MSRSLPVLRPLLDANDRKITYLRVSLTDRCNYRCTYCMPAEGVDLLPREDILSFEEITRLARVFAQIGVKKIRLTGGEPTIRQRVADLVAMLAGVSGIERVVMTTNGHRLPELARPLAGAGLAEVNVSIDTLDADKFRAITRRGDLSRVLAGIDAALAAGMKVKLNAVALKGFNDDEVAALCEYAWARGVAPRFIEHMPMSDGSLYAPGKQLAAAEIRARVEQAFGGPLVAEGEHRADGPARYWHVPGNERARVGIISAMTEHFCDTCNRVRLTAVGDLHTCLAYDDALSLRTLLRGGASDDEIVAALRDAVAGKRAGHSFQSTGAGAPTKHMISIGG